MARRSKIYQVTDEEFRTIGFIGEQLFRLFEDAGINY